MLIICADDFGRDRAATDACMECHRGGAITAASAMVFMEDSARAARLAGSEGLETGLHLNLVVPFDGPGIPEKLRMSQDRIARYLQRGKWAQSLYNPLIRKALAMSLGAQLDEYRRLLQREPVHLNGHKHMHLCMNMIIDGLIPKGPYIRRNFTFGRGEKGLFNRAYRRWVDAWLLREHPSTDAFFSIDPVSDIPRLKRIIALARTSDVELMVHPGWPDQHAFLREGEFRALTAAVPRGPFGALRD